MSGEASADPRIEHLIQSTAFLNARIGKRLDDDYAELTEALLGMLYGHYLRPIPACSIARFDCGDAKAINAVTTLPRGTELKASIIGSSCQKRVGTNQSTANWPFSGTHLLFLGAREHGVNRVQTSPHGHRLSKNWVPSNSSTSRRLD
jgi:type VI protein secretion system component VasA